MVNIRKIVVDGIVVIEWEIRVWDKSDFIVRFGPGQEVQFHIDRIYEPAGEAHCTVVSGEDVLQKRRVA